MTLQGILTAISNLNGTVEDYRAIQSVVKCCMENATGNIINREIVPRLAAGQVVRVKMNWGKKGTKTGTIEGMQAFKRKTISVTVDGMPPSRNKYRVAPSLIMEVIS